MKTELYASIGWNQADCAVCATPTRMRIRVGDGCAPICSPTCEAAWPNVSKLYENAKRLQEERNALRSLLERVIDEVDDGTTPCAAVKEAEVLLGRRTPHPIPETKKENER